VNESSQDLNKIENPGNGPTHREKTANTSIKVNKTPYPRMGSKKSEKNRLGSGEKISTSILGQIESSTGLGITFNGPDLLNADRLGVKTPNMNNGPPSRATTESVWALTESESRASQNHRRHHQSSTEARPGHELRPMKKTSKTWGVKRIFDSLNQKARKDEVNLKSKIVSLSEKATEVAAILRILIAKCLSSEPKAPVVTEQGPSLNLSTSLGESLGLKNSEDLWRELDTCRVLSPCMITLGTTSKEGSELREGACAIMEGRKDTEYEDWLDFTGEESLTTFESAHSSGLTKRGEKEERWTMHLPNKKKKSISFRCAMTSNGDIGWESVAWRAHASHRGTRGSTSKERAESLATCVTLDGPSKLIGSRYECLSMDNEPDSESESGEAPLTSESVHPYGLTKWEEEEECLTRHRPKKKKAKSSRRAKKVPCTIYKNKPSRVHTARNQQEEATTAASCCPEVNLLDLPSHSASSSSSLTQSPRNMGLNLKEETARAMVSSETKEELVASKQGDGGERSSLQISKELKLSCSEEIAQALLLSEIKDEMEGSEHWNWGVSNSDAPTTRVEGWTPVGVGELNTGVVRKEPEAVEHEQGKGRGPPMRNKARGRRGKQNSVPLKAPGANGAPDLIQETQGDWIISSASMSSDGGRCWLKKLATSKGEPNFCRLPSKTIAEIGKTNGFINNLGVGGIEGEMFKIAEKIGRSFIITGGKRSEWARTGPTNGVRLVYDRAKEYLRIWTKKRAPTEVSLGEVEEPEVEDEGNEENEVNIVRDSLGRIQSAEDQEDVVENLSMPVICQRIVPQTIRERLFGHSQGIKQIIEACRVWDGIQYPPPGTNEVFNGVICRMRVGPSKISGRGTFLVKGTLLKNELLGIYEGIRTLLRGPYVMEMFKGADLKSIDGDPKALGFESPFGMMNEDLYRGVPNIEVLPSGMFRAIRDIAEGEELVIQYSTKYDWSGLKEEVFKDLSREIALVIPEMWNWIPKSWEEVKLNRDHISRRIKKIIDGSMETLETLSLHSSSNTEQMGNPKDTLSRVLTSGITARRYNFKIWKREDRIWESLPYDRDRQRREMFSRRWTNQKLMDIPFNTVVEDNSNIRDFMRQVRLMVKPKPSILSMCPAVLVRSGDIKVSLDLGNKRLDKHLKALNKLSQLSPTSSICHGQQCLAGDL
jgi:hypothetical protein